MRKILGNILCNFGIHKWKKLTALIRTCIHCHKKSMIEIRENTVKKGGTNLKPTTSPPTPPKGQGGNLTSEFIKIQKKIIQTYRKVVRQYNETIRMEQSLTGKKDKEYIEIDGYLLRLSSPNEHHMYIAGRNSCMLEETLTIERKTTILQRKAFEILIKNKTKK